MSSIIARLENPKNSTQLAARVVSVFISEAPNAVDCNQLAMNTVIAETLKTGDFSSDFERLLWQKKFDFDKVVDHLDPNGYMSTFDAYIDEKPDVGEYKEINLVDTMMFTLMKQSNLMKQLLSIAEDIEFDNAYTEA